MYPLHKLHSLETKKQNQNTCMVVPDVGIFV